MWPEPEPEAVASESREDMQVHVKDLLHGGLAVRKEEVDTLALQTTRTLGSDDALRDLHEATSRLTFELGQVSDVSCRDDEDVPRIHRLDIHEGGAVFVAIDERARHLTRQDAAEDTIRLPASSSTARRLANACRACASNVSPATCPVAGSMPGWPAVKMRSPTRTACEYGPMRGTRALSTTSSGNAMEPRVIVATTPMTTSMMTRIAA
jgi:hypothetical protein